MKSISTLSMVTILLFFGQSAMAAPIAKHGAYSYVEFPTIDGSTTIGGYVLEASGGGSQNWAILTHACNGVLNKKGKIRQKYSAMATRLRDIGISSLLVDSHTPRGEKSICKVPGKKRSIDSLVRTKDHLGAAAYIKRTHSGAKVALVGWGPGALDALNTSNDIVDRTDKLFIAAAMFYPPCRSGGGESPFSPYAPILIVVGEADDWEPARICRDLIDNKKQGSESVELKTYADTHHAFDNINTPIRTSSHARGTSTTGSNPTSTQDAYRRISNFFLRTMDSASK